MGYLVERNKRNSGDIFASGHIRSGTVANPGVGVLAQSMKFTETTGAGVYTGAVVLPAGSLLLDIIVSGVSLWTAATSATLKVGDTTDDDGYFTGVDLKATDLLAGEDLSLSAVGGKQGADVANSQINRRYSSAARTINGIVTTVGTTGAAGVTVMTVLYVLADSTYANGANVVGAATKV